jgi:hypothetical protein
MLHSSRVFTASEGYSSTSKLRFSLGGAMTAGDIIEEIIIEMAVKILNKNLNKSSILIPPFICSITQHRINIKPSE